MGCHQICTRLICFLRHHLITELKYFLSLSLARFVHSVFFLRKKHRQDLTTATPDMYLNISIKYPLDK